MEWKRIMSSEIKSVTFDFGGVISYPRSAETNACLARLAGLPCETFEELDRKYRGEWDRGTYDGAGYYRFMLSHAGIFPDDEALARIVRTDLEGWQHINPATVQLMRDIKASGFILGILSNMSHDFLAWAQGRIPFSEADVAVYSCEYNIIKPEPAIYEKLREQTNCEYNKIAFFDDTVDNIVMAKKLGIQGFVWERPETARAQLMSMGLEFTAYD
jgi:putative hydrolase of the HAD superfamily